MSDTLDRPTTRSASARTLLGTPDDATLAALMDATLRHVLVDRLRAGHATSGGIDVGRLELDPAAVERVRLSGARFELRCGSAVLRNVRAIVELGFTVDWRYDLKWLGGDTGSQRLGSKASTVELHDIELPMLQDFTVELPEVSLDDVAISIDPVDGLRFGPTRLHDITLDDTRLPRDGFAVTDLDIGPIELSDAVVPGTATRRVHIGEVEPDAPLRLPAITLRDISLPTIAVADAGSDGPVSIMDAALEIVEAPLFKIGSLFTVKLSVTPVLHLQIGELVLADLQASAAVDEVGVAGVTAAARVHDLAIEALELDDIAVDTLTV